METEDGASILPLARQEVAPLNFLAALPTPAARLASRISTFFTEGGRQQQIFDELYE